jgi:D-amino-acid dehydrogenase
VTVIDDDAEGKAASWGCAGHIATEQVEPLASWGMIASAPRRMFSLGGPISLPPADIGHWLPFMRRLIGRADKAHFDAGRAALSRLMAGALPAWQRLTVLAGCAALLRRDGHLIVWESPASAAVGLKAWQATDIGQATFAPLTPADGEALGRLKYYSGIRFAGTGHVSDLPALAEALRAHIVARGGRIEGATVTGLSTYNGQATIAFNTGESRRADRIVICAGARTPALLHALGTRVPLIAERGYHIEAAAPAWPSDLPPVVFQDRAVIVTRFRKTLRAASFVEFSQVGRPPDPRKWQRLHRHAEKLGLPFEGPIKQWVGARPTLPDYLPAMGRSRRADNLWYAFGHQHLGLTLGPVTGELMAELMTGAPPTIDMTPYDIDRFAEASR